MKYCIYCGHEINIQDNKCPFCGEDISDNTTNKIYHSNIKCIKCGSSNVDYEIKKINKNNIIYEEETYNCNECGKKFTDKDRLGPSFNNFFQITFGKENKNIIKWCIVILIVILSVVYIEFDIKREEDSWVKMDCTGLPTITFKEIKEGAPYSDDKFIGNSYIFTTTIKEINNREIVTPIEEDDYTGSYITVNKEELQKLSKYKEGDSINFCGTVKDISLYHKVYVKNATIIE